MRPVPYWTLNPGRGNAYSISWTTIELHFRRRRSGFPRELRGRRFGASPDSPLTEDSPCRPISEYGRHKLDMEQRLQAWAAGRNNVSTLMGRISNIYGPRQNLSKPQGIISHFARCLIHQRPIHVYMPLDTIRDYIYIDDCADQVIDACRAAARTTGQRII